MALDLHSKVKIQEIIRAELTNQDVVTVLLTYKVKRGRKLHKLWALPSDLRGCNIFPVCYRIMNSGKYADVLTMTDEIIFTGKVSECKKFVKFGNKQYIEGA